MFRVGDALRRRVSIRKRDGAVVIRIERHHQWKSYILLLACFTAAFLFFFTVFARALFYVHSAVQRLYVLPFMAFILTWYLLALRIGLWRGFGVEILTIHGGHLHWERTAWKWHRKLDILLSDVSDVKARTPWQALANRVEFICKGRRCVIGDMLLQDEANEIARELDKARDLLPPLR
jgi:hypothetical protein